MTMSPEAELGYKLQQAQAENERLTQRRDLARKLVLLCAAERRQAQARVKRLEETGQALHDAVDDLNAASRVPRDLCFLCGSNAYGVNGLEHTSVCTLALFRAAIAEGDTVAKKVWEGGHGHSVECIPNCRLQEGDTDDSQD